MSYSFTAPAHTLMGKDALKQSESLMKSFGKKALIVTGKIVTQTGLTKILTTYLDDFGISYEIFNDIIGEPTDTMIQAGIKIYRETHCDFLIAIGGGSPLDSAKAISAFSILKGNLSDYVGKDLVGEFPPLVLIPTTAGTGSEATQFTVITDSKKQVKMLLKGESLLPRLAIIDASLTLSAPKSITAATGMDALTHAIEAYTSKKSTPLTDLYALDAIQRIFTYLPLAYLDGGNEKAREEMALAAYEAGICINNASVTLVHGMSRPIGALFHVPHGLSNAMLLKACLTYALDGAYDRFAAIGRCIGVADSDTPDLIAAKAFLEKLEHLCKICEIPTLSEYGISQKAFNHQIPKMAQDAFASGSPSNTRKPLTTQDLIEIYTHLWH